MRRPACTTPQTRRDVFLLDFPIAELSRQLLVRGVVLGDNHQPGCSAVQPVHDARTDFAADAAETLDVMQERIDERSAAVPGSRVHDHARRLVQHHHIIVFIHDAQRQGFRFDGRRLRRRYVDRERLTGAHLRARSKTTAGPGHTAVFDQALQLRARLLGQQRRQEVIQARPIVIGLDENDAEVSHSVLGARGSAARVSSRPLLRGGLRVRLQGRNGARAGSASRC